MFNESKVTLLNHFLCLCTTTSKTTSLVFTGTRCCSHDLITLHRFRTCIRMNGRRGQGAQGNGMEGRWFQFDSGGPTDIDGGCSEVSVPRSSPGDPRLRNSQPTTFVPKFFETKRSQTARARQRFNLPRAARIFSYPARAGSSETLTPDLSFDGGGGNGEPSRGAAGPPQARARLCARGPLRHLDHLLRRRHRPDQQVSSSPPWFPDARCLSSLAPLDSIAIRRLLRSNCCESRRSAHVDLRV